MNFLPAPLLGLVSALLFVTNTVLFFSAMLPFILLKIFIPNSWIRHHLTRVAMFFGTTWIDVNSFIQKLTRHAKWDIQGLEGFNLDSSYLVVCNHRSWTDIFVLQHIFNHRIPFLKFFLKKELIWVPILGVAWWALDFPFMKRYTRQFIEKHPELKGKDVETTRKYCAKFKRSPVTVLNFLEGTRFNYQKHEKQNSPFRHLLMPKAGGVGIVLSSMGEYLSKIVDVSIVYPENEPPMPFWNFLKGNIPTIVVRLRTLNIPEEFLGKNYEEDDVFKDQFQKWINGLWKEKDQTIASVFEDYNTIPGKK
ncbi:MAG: acyltransferase [Desulfobacteraceae bacterium]|nr:acyltransferase [Desulfobacteraceae bacterium]MBC2755731.1 acyltransferase [Desulfobacteraceae bacterium]